MEIPPLTVLCPKCGTAFPIPADSAENRIRCPRCGEEIAVPVPLPPPIELPRTQPSPIQPSPIQPPQTQPSRTLPAASEMPPQAPVPEGFSVHPEEKLPDQLPETFSEPLAALPDLPANHKIDEKTDDSDGDSDGGLEDELDEELDEEDNPFWLRAPFLFGLGVIAALLVMILILVLKQPVPVSTPVSTPMPEADFEQIADRLAVSDEGERGLASDDFNPNGSGIDLKLTGEGETDDDDENSDDDENPDEAGDTAEDAPIEMPAENSLTETAPAENPQETEPEKTASSVTEEIGETVPDRSVAALPDSAIPLAALNISEQLALPLKSVEIPGWTLPEWVKILSDMTHIPISLRFEAFESFPRSASQTAAVHLQETTAGDLLQEAARLFGLDVEQNPDGVILTPPAGPVQSRTLDLTDLLSENPSDRPIPAPSEETLAPHWLPVPLTADVLTAYLTDLSFPDGGISMNAPNPENKFTWDGPQLTITGEAPYVAQICRCIEILRVLRKINPGTEWSSEELIPAAIGREDLYQPLSLGFLTPPTLYEGLEFLARTVGKQILIDTAALRQAGISEQTRRPFRCEAHPAFWGISEFLAGYGLTWGMPASDLIFVTTKERGWISTEVHLYRNPNQAQNPAADTIPENVHPLLSSPGLHYWIEPVSGSLIVQAEADIQRTICRILTTPETAPETTPNAAPDTSPAADNEKISGEKASNEKTGGEKTNTPQPESPSDAEEK